MKKLAIILCGLLLVPVLSAAQNQVKASYILQQIDKGEKVNYQDVKILGDLDLTAVEDITLNNPKDKRRRKNVISRIFTGSRYKKTLVYSCHINVPLTFKNCVFQGSVLGYRHDRRENETYNVYFHEAVSFSGCEFQEVSTFKYTRFEKQVDFTETKFRQNAFFKYTKFATSVPFSSARFLKEANFKYTKFPEPVYFDNAIFNRYANFKYARFSEGVTFAEAEFNNDAGFKYANFYGPVNFTGTVFDEDIILKYTKLNGRKVSYNLLKKVKH